MVGRATLYGATVGGEAGAARVIKLYREEISRNMALLGCSTIDQLGPQCLQFVDSQLRPPSLARPALRAIDTKAAAEGRS